MSTRFEFVAFDPEKNIFYESSCIDLLLHMDGEVQQHDGDSRVVGILNVPRVRMYQRLKTRDYLRGRIDEGSIVEVTHPDLGIQRHMIVKWVEEENKMVMERTIGGNLMRSEITESRIMEWRVKRIGHIETHKDLIGGVYDGLPNS